MAHHQYASEVNPYVHTGAVQEVVGGRFALPISLLGRGGGRPRLLGPLSVEEVWQAWQFIQS